jgi:hypothetical protein
MQRSKDEECISVTDHMSKEDAAEFGGHAWHVKHERGHWTQQECSRCGLIRNKLAGVNSYWRYRGPEKREGPNPFRHRIYYPDSVPSCGEMMMRKVLK